jgi:CelD/BcsL family acetyltransferase involved in cellulose biosynthesis
VSGGAVVTFRRVLGDAEAKAFRERGGDLLFKLPQWIAARLDLKGGHLLVVTVTTVNPEEVEQIGAENASGEDKGEDVKGGSPCVH